MSDEAPAKTIRISRKGRITIPAEFRRQLGIDEETMFLMALVNGELRLVPIRDPGPDKGSAWVREVYDAFAPIREEFLSHGTSEEEIDADIDAAIAEVHPEHRAKRH